MPTEDIIRLRVWRTIVTANEIAAYGAYRRAEALGDHEGMAVLEAEMEVLLAERWEATRAIKVAGGVL